MADIENAVQKTMHLLSEYTIADANKILEGVSAKLTAMAAASAPRPPNGKPPTTDTP